LVDGYPGVEKTSVFAPKIAKAVNGMHVEMDDYLIDSSKTVGRFTFDEKRLKDDLSEFLKLEKVVLDGIMIAKIMENIGQKELTHVYVESETARSLWDKDYGTYADKSLNEILKDEEVFLKKININAKLPYTQYQLIQYLYEKKPFENADYLIQLDSR